MKKNKLLLLALVAVLGVGCFGPDDTPTTTTSTTTTTTPPTTDVPPPPPPGPDPQPALTYTVPDGTEVRNYDERFDQVLVDYSTVDTLTAPSGVTFVDKDILKVVVSDVNPEVSAPISDDASIYKMAKPDTFATSLGIGFNIRLVSGELALSQLELRLRGSDDHLTYPIALNDAVDANGDELPALTDEFQDVVVGTASIDAEAVYKNKDGTDSDLNVSNNIIGFHLVAKENVSATIEISEVFYYNASQVKTTLDNFNHDTANAPQSAAWWNDSTGRISRRHIEVNAGSVDVELSDDALMNYHSVVLNASGITTGLTVAPILKGATDNVVLEAKPFADLKNTAGEALPALPTGASFNLVANLVESGFEIDVETDTLIGLRLTGTADTKFNLFHAYLTNMELPQLELVYPTLDIENRKLVDDYEDAPRPALTNVYNDALAAYEEHPLLNWALSYAESDKISIANGSLTFAATAGYINYQFSTRNSRVDEEYLVFKAPKTANFAGFRFAGSGGGATALWSNDWVAMEGLKSIPETLEDYPYVVGESVYYIVDLKQSGADLATYTDMLDLYYTGDGLVIEEIFFANKWEVFDIAERNIIPEKEVAAAEGYNELGRADIIKEERFLELKFLAAAGVGDEVVETTLASFRITYGAAEYWLDPSNAAGDIVLKGTSTYDVSSNLPVYVADDPETTEVFEATEPLTLMIDLHKTVGTPIDTTLVMHFGGFALEIFSASVYSEDLNVNTTTPFFSEIAVANTGDYTYLGGTDDTSTIGLERYLVLTATSVEDATVTLDSLRIAHDGGEVSSANLVTLYGASFSVVLSDATVYIVVDLVASGISLDTSKLHVHFGDATAQATGNAITISGYFAKGYPTIADSVALLAE